MLVIDIWTIDNHNLLITHFYAANEYIVKSVYKFVFSSLLYCKLIEAIEYFDIIQLKIPWWRHQIWKHFPRYWSPVNYPHKGQWRGALMCYLFCVWINGWVNTREAGDLRRHRAHYDVTVMLLRWATANYKLEPGEIKIVSMNMFAFEVPRYFVTPRRPFWIISPDQWRKRLKIINNRGTL